MSWLATWLLSIIFLVGSAVFVGVWLSIVILVIERVTSLGS